MDMVFADRSLHYLYLLHLKQLPDFALQLFAALAVQHLLSVLRDPYYMACAIPARMC